MNKRINILLNKIDILKFYNLEDSLNLIKKMSNVNFLESLDIYIKFNISNNLKNQKIIGYTSFPHGNGKKNYIGVIVHKKDFKIAKESGADVFETNDLLCKLKNNKKKIDIVILSSDAIDIFKSYFKNILNSKELTPNNKIGTITSNIINSIKKAKMGQTIFKIYKNNILNVSIGKLNFSNDMLKDNIKSLFVSIGKVLFIQNKKKIIDKIYLSSTMGISLKIDKNNLINLLNIN